MRWQNRLANCRSQLIHWNRRTFKRRELNITALMSKLTKLQQNWSAHIDEITETTKLVDRLLVQEESFWHQRSRVKWLREGDANTKFFHQSTLHRRRSNHVLKLKTENGTWEERPHKVKGLIDDYFISLFTSTRCRE